MDTLVMGLFLCLSQLVGFLMSTDLSSEVGGFSW